MAENGMRLIDATALIEHLQREATRPFVAPTALPLAFRAYADRVVPRLIYDVIHFVERWPSVDAVEVVRCKDCKWAGTYVGSDGKEWVDCTYHYNVLCYKDDFCSHGQRRAE